MFSDRPNDLLGVERKGKKSNIVPIQKLVYYKKEQCLFFFLVLQPMFKDFIFQVFSKGKNHMGMNLVGKATVGRKDTVKCGALEKCTYLIILPLEKDAKQG